MIELTNEQLAHWKEALTKDGIVYDSNKEYLEAINNLVGYFDLLIEIEKQQKLGQ